MKFFLFSKETNVDKDVYKIFGIKITFKKVPIKFNKKKFNNKMIGMLRGMSTTGEYSNECLENGFLIVPVHFYQPIPDIKVLEERKVWDKVSSLSGIKFDDNVFIKNLESISHYSSECVWANNPTENSNDFYVNNGCFSYVCAATLHSIIRQNKPKRIIEVGSGNSSKIIRNALQKNKEEGSCCEEYTIIDPYSGIDVINFDGDTKLLTEPVETVDLNVFKSLEENDILFIDSSHVCKIGSDVNRVILDILPILQRGVFIHFHDIGLPYEYSKVYATNSTFRMFWTEAYLLQAFLAFNSEFEVYLPMVHILTKHMPTYQEFFPNTKDYSFICSGSFWIKRT